MPPETTLCLRPSMLPMLTTPKLREAFIPPRWRPPSSHLHRHVAAGQQHRDRKRKRGRGFVAIRGSHNIGAIQ